MTPKELAQLASARTESGVELFLADISRHPLLSAAEEVALAKRVSVATSLPRRRWSTRTCASSSRSPSAIAPAAFPSST